MYKCIWKKYKSKKGVRDVVAIDGRHRRLLSLSRKTPVGVKLGT